MTTMVWVYLGYSAICVLVTLAVAHTLRKHGPVFIEGTSEDASPLIRAKTHLMVVGFYLVCLGLIGFALRYGGSASDAKSAIELLATKTGGMTLIIGLMHFGMIVAFVAAREKPIKETRVRTATPAMNHIDN